MVVLVTLYLGLAITTYGVVDGIKWRDWFSAGVFGMLMLGAVITIMHVGA